MLSYNQQRLDAVQIRKMTRYYAERQLLSDEAVQQIEAAQPTGFYTPNFFVRVGLFIFGGICISAFVGIIFLFFSPGSGTAFSLLAIVVGMLLLFVLEKYIIDTRNHYKSGLDDVFAYSGIAYILSGILSFWSFDLPAEAYWLAGGLAGGLAAMRYADALLMLASVVCFTLLMFAWVDRFAGSSAMLLLPATGMLCAAGWYFLSQYVQAREEMRFWKDPFQWVEAAALLLFYVSGNYWCIHYGAVNLYGADTVSLKIFFWAFTFLIPIVYLAGGLYRRDRLLLDMGIVCIGAALFTYRAFHAVLPFEWAITLIGAFCVALSWFSIRYLRTHSRIFTYAPDGDLTDLQKIVTNRPGPFPTHF